MEEEYDQSPLLVCSDYTRWVWGSNSGEVGVIRQAHSQPAQKKTRNAFLSMQTQGNMEERRNGVNHVSKCVLHNCMYLCIQMSCDVSYNRTPT